MDTSFLLEGLKKVEGHLIPTDKTIEAFTEIYDVVQPSKVLEIGFNAGHSAYMSLTMLPEVVYNSVDIGRHSYTQVNADRLKDIFGERFDYEEINSQDMTPSSIEDYDLIFIDGDHSVKGITSDLNLANDAKMPYILVDDYNPKWFRVIIELVNHFLNKENFPYKIVKTFNYESTGGINTSVLLRRVK